MSERCTKARRLLFTRMVRRRRRSRRDKGILRQDRYPLRTSPQWVGPQVEELLRAWDVISIECNSTTDNPLIDAKTNTVHHGGNFQAMALTTVMESSRLRIAPALLHTFHAGH